jgi:hypothetical protein
MNTIESRIHSDAICAAAEITQADIPPLRLDHPPGRSLGRRRARATGTTRTGMTRTGLARPAGARRWLAAAGAVGCVAGVVAATVVVGHLGATGHRGARSVSRPASGAHSAKPVVSQAQATLAAEALDYYFPASGAQYTAGFAFQWTLLKTESPAYQACMLRAGFPVQPFSVKELTFIQEFPNNSQFPDLAQRAQDGSMQGAPPLYPNGLALPLSTAGTRAAQTCRAAAEGQFAQFDTIASPLMGRWLDIVTAIQQSAPVAAMQPSFSACLEAHGVPASLAERTDQGASNMLFYGFFSWADGLGQTATSNSEQVAADHRAAEVFVACAGPTVTVAERLQLAQRARFFTEHAVQVSKIETLAEAIPKASR